jgi:phospholipid-binding lipoprotein MlaA
MRDRLRDAVLACCACLACAALSGCATTGAERPGDAKDPFESANRAIYKFNDVVDRATLKPIAKGYKWITPEWFRHGVGNFFSNLQYPATVLNQLLQGKPGAAARDTGRLLMNTVLGLGGVLDPATRAGLDKNDEDLGQTLGVWGVPTGPYIVLPFLGPTTVRDAPSTVAETFLDPLSYADVEWEVLWGLRAVDIVDSRAQLLSLEPVLERTFDPYAFVRNAFLQRREFQVRDGDVPEEDLEEELLEDESMDEEPEQEPETEADPVPE